MKVCYIRFLLNLRKQTKMIKLRLNPGICWDKKEKATQEKITIQHEKINQKVLEKEGWLKRYRQGVKQCRQNRTSQNKERKFYQQVGWDDTKTYQQPDAREAEQFWCKICQPRENNKKSRMDKQHGKRVSTLLNNTKNIKLENARPWLNT